MQQNDERVIDWQKMWPDDACYGRSESDVGEIEPQMDGTLTSAQDSNVDNGYDSDDQYNPTIDSVRWLICIFRYFQIRFYRHKTDYADADADASNRSESIVNTHKIRQCFFVLLHSIPTSSM